MTVAASIRWYVEGRLGKVPRHDAMYQEVIDIVDRAVIDAALKHTRGNQSQAAKVLGINRNTLLKKIRKLKGGASEIPPRR